MQLQTISQRRSVGALQWRAPTRCRTAAGMPATGEELRRRSARCAASTSPSRRVACAVSSARTAPASRRSPRSSPASTSRMPARSHLDGAPVRFTGADDALAQRIVTVHQDINLVQTMTVAENLLLNNEPTYRFGIIRRKDDARRRSREPARAIRDRRRPGRRCRRLAERPQEDGADRQGGEPGPAGSCFSTSRRRR